MSSETKTAELMKTVFVDIMTRDGFYDQITYRYSPLFQIDGNDVERAVLERHPELKKRRYRIEFSGMRAPRR